MSKFKAGFGNLKHKFMEFCRMFLYSENVRVEDKAFDIIVNRYLSYIMTSDDAISMSMFDDVVCKVFGELENEDAMKKTGKKYERFTMLLSALSRISKYNLKRVNGNCYSIIYKYIIGMKKECLTESRRDFIKLILKKDIICLN